MKKRLFTIFIFLGFTINILAGHHFESDLAKKFPQLDLTDIFVFKSSTPNKTVFIMAFNPTSQKNTQSNYASNGIYRFSIGSNPNFTDGLSPTFTFKNNQLQFYIANKPEPSLAETGEFIGQGPIDKKLEFSNGINIWTGTVLDLFQGNAVGIDAFRENAAKGIYDLKVFDIGEEGNVFKQLPSTVIVMEIPNEMLPKKIFYYASTSVEESKNHWHRVNRIANVLFPHTYLLDDQAKFKYLNSNHEVDPSVKEAIFKNVLNFVTIAGYQKDPKKYTDQLIERIYPDVLTYTVGTDAIYGIETRNGRPLQDDAMNIALALLVGSDQPIDDKVSVNLARFQSNFPYVVPIDDSKLETIKIEVANDTNISTSPSEINKNKQYALFYYLGGLLVVLAVIFSIIRVKNKK